VAAKGNEDEKGFVWSKTMILNTSVVSVIHPAAKIVWSRRSYRYIFLVSGII
jgi:hypothetical protein